MPYNTQSTGKPERLTAFEIDHLGYLTDRKYRREVHAGYRRIARKKGQLVEQTIVHESDDSCCQREDWTATALRIQKGLAADGLRVGWMFTTGTEAALVLPPTDEETAS